MENTDTVVEMVAEWDKTLKDFEAKLGMSEAKAPGDETELENYLTMPIDELRKLNSEGCAEISYRLNQYSFYLQRIYNINLGRVKRLNSILDGYAGGKLEGYNKFWKYEERLNAPCCEDGYAGKIKSMIRQFQNRVDRMYDLHNSLNKLANDMKSLSYSKREAYNG